MPKLRGGVFTISVSLPGNLLPWIENKKKQGFNISAVVAALILAEWKSETGKDHTQEGEEE